jgi:hypothetical protein
MNQLMHLKQIRRIGLLAAITVMGLVSVSPLYAHSIELLEPGVRQTCERVVNPEPKVLQVSSLLSFDFNVTGDLMPGVLGLPGEPVGWVITLTNNGQVAGQDVVVTGTVHDALQIEDMTTTHGTASVSEQVVVFSIPVLNPGETAEMVIHTTVLRSPPDGRLLNKVLLAATGPDGAIAQRVSAEISVPTGLPATGYAPPPGKDLPGEGEPSAAVFGLVAFGVVGLAAAFVWYRGRRRF